MENHLNLRLLIRESLNSLLETQPTESKKDKESENNDPELEALEVEHELNSEGQQKIPIS